MEDVSIREFKVTSPVATGLRDPYTGDAIEVVGRVSGPVVTFSSPAAFSLAEPVKSVDELYARASMRAGVQGAVDRAGSLFCAYTGRKMTLERTPDGRWYFSGGFNPRAGKLSLADFIRDASCGAVSPEPPVRAEHADHVPAEHVAGADTSVVGEELEEISEKVCRSIGADRGRTTVSGFERKHGRRSK